MTEAAASDPSRDGAAGPSLRAPARLLPDERLARRATSGDRRAFEEIFRRYHQDLYRFCLATASNPQDAQEALQNTMVKVMRALPGEQREIKLKPWLFRIARNEAVETMRKRRDTVELGADRIASPWEITDAASARERLRELFSDLAELPERQRSALVMRELAGLEFAEIGEAFGTSATVARQTLYEARQSLRQMEGGREMSCATVRRAISDDDGRVTRRRDIRAHLRDCVGCRTFRDDIARRHHDFAAVASLPAAISAGLLEGVLGGQATAGAVAAGGAAGGAASGGVGGAIGVGAGKAVATSAIVKSAATVAVVTAVGVGAADRGGLIDLPSPRSGGDPSGSAPASPAAPAGTKAAPGGGSGGGASAQGSAGTKGDGGPGEASAAGRAKHGEGGSRGSAKAKHPAQSHHPGGQAHGRPGQTKAPAGRGGHPPQSKASPKPESPARVPGTAPAGKPAGGEPSLPPQAKATPPPQSSKPPQAESTGPPSSSPKAAPASKAAPGKGASAVAESPDEVPAP